MKYQVLRKVSSNPPVWIDRLLLSLSPDVYRPAGTLAASREKLLGVLLAIHRSRLEATCPGVRVSSDEDSITLSRRAGHQIYLKFYIQACL